MYDCRFHRRQNDSQLRHPAGSRTLRASIPYAIRSDVGVIGKQGRHTMNELNARYEPGPETMAPGQRHAYAAQSAVPLTPAQRKTLEHTELKVAALSEQNRAILAEFHKLTGNRYAPERLYV